LFILRNDFVNFTANQKAYKFVCVIYSREQYTHKVMAMGRKPKYGVRSVRIDALLPPDVVKEMEKYKKEHKMSWGDLILDLWEFYKANKPLVVSNGNTVL